MTEKEHKADKADKAHEPVIQSSKAQVVSVKFFTTRNLSVIVVGAVLIIAMTRADTKDIPKIIEILADSHHSAVLGWSIALLILISAVFLIKIMFKIHDREIERIVKERDQLQKKLLEIGDK